MIVDDSRIVRATIIKRIRDRFDVREETDGEDGWEALLIDPSIRLVITDHTMPRLDGYGFIERIRSSKVARIRDLPVIMISGDEGEEARQRATSLGASDFITKGTGTAELLARLDTLVELGRSHAALEEARADAATDHLTGLAQRGVLERQAEQAVSYVRRHGGHLGIMVVGIDHATESLVADDGVLLESLLKSFAEVLSGIVRKEDGLAHWAPTQFALVTPGVDPAQTHIFAERVRHELAIVVPHIPDFPVPITVTVGMACVPEDGDLDGSSLFELAERRLIAAQSGGGNCVAGPVARTEFGAVMSAEEALGFIHAGRDAVVRAGAREFAKRLMPLLKIIGAELDAEWAVAELERSIASKESSSNQSLQDQEGV